MKYHFFIGDGANAASLLMETREQLVIRETARRNLCQQYNAVTLLCEGERVIGLVYDSVQEEGAKKMLKYHSSCKEGYAYTPRLNTKAGKALRDILHNDAELNFDPYEHIIEKLHARRMLFEGMRIYQTAVGWTEDKILLKVPGEFSKNREHGKDPFPELPAWLRKVKESEFLAAQGR